MKIRIILAALVLSYCQNAQQNEEKSSTGEFSYELQSYPGQFSLTAEETSKLEDEVRPEHPDGDEMLLRLAARLDLSEHQIESLKPIFENIRSQMDAIKAKMDSYRDSGTRPTREQMDAIRIQVDEIHKSAREEIRPILTEEQNTEFDAIAEECRGHMPPPPPR